MLQSCMWKKCLCVCVCNSKKERCMLVNFKLKFQQQTLHLAHQAQIR